MPERAPPINHFQTARQSGPALVITDQPTRDAAQVTGRWLESDAFVEVRP